MGTSETRIILSRDDFRTLIRGETVEVGEVKIRLAEMDFLSMVNEVIEAAPPGARLRTKAKMEKRKGRDLN